MTEGLFTEEEARHPMWTPPPIHHALPGHVRALRKEIARQLKRFDGRPDMDVPVAYCRVVYEGTLVSQCMQSTAYLIGDLILRSARSAALVKKGSSDEPGKKERSANKRDAAIIQDLTEKFVEAITKEYLS